MVMCVLVWTFGHVGYRNKKLFVLTSSWRMADEQVPVEDVGAAKPTSEADGGGGESKKEKKEGKKSARASIPRAVFVVSTQRGTTNQQ